MSARALRHRIEHACFRAARAAWSHLPERTALGSGAALGALAGGALRFRRTDVDRHIGWAFPDASPSWRAALAGACYRHFGREAVATLRAAGWSPEEMRARTTFVGSEELRAAAEAGAGAVLLTGHLGNWEIGGAAIAARGVPLDVVGKGMSNRRFEKDLFALRERLGMRVIEMGDASRLALRSLAAGRVVALLGDQSAHGGGVLVPFFGREAVTARGPALFAVRSGAPVFVGFALRGKGPEARYRMTLEPLPHTPSGDVERDVLALTRAYTRALETAVKAAPEQYLWQHRRWKGAP
ncbi:MAG TPA: lysophospholipid acyltransferase family protein [Longimicrobiales bacterium]|nr:lysophospholipid acyltransferase family protein [Longimicrobiales bacterium]